MQNKAQVLIRGVLAAVAGWCLLGVLSASAESETSGETVEYTGVYTLEEVVVSATQEGTTAAGTIRNISAEDIQTRGARTLDEALEMVPGLNIRTGGKGVPRINLRGLRTRHVLLLLDGIPINSTYDGMFDPSILPVENIKEIRVTTGGSSVLYGQGALGGVINIITKRGRPGLHGMINHEFGEHIKYNGRYSLCGLEDKLDFFLSGSLYKTDGYELSNDFEETSEENGGLRENSDRTRKSCFAKLGYTPTDKLQLGLIFNYAEGDHGVPPNTINNKQDPFSKKVKFERVDDFNQYSLQISANYDAPGPLEIKTWLYYNEFDQERNRYDDDNYNSMDDIYIKKTYYQNTETRTMGGNLQARCDLGRFGLLSMGLGVEKNWWEADGKIRDKMVSIGGVTEADQAGGGGSGTGGGGGGSSPGGKKKKYYYMRHFDRDRDIGIYTAALEYEFSPADDIIIALGYSHLWQRKQSDDDDGEYSFVIGATYDIFQDTRLAGSVSRKVRFPSISQLYDEVKGNPDLDPERSYNYELGLTQQLPGNTRLSLTGFCNDIEDFIQKDAFTDRNENRDRYRFRGIEVSVETHPWNGLMFKAGYTYLDTDDMSSGTTKDEVQYNPRDKLTLEARYTAPFGLTVYTSVRHINRQYYYSKKTPYQKRRLNEYTLVNVKLSQKLLRDRLMVYLGADNLFDKDYETSYGLPQPGRFVYGGVKVPF